MSKALAIREEQSPALHEKMEEILSNIVLKGDISGLKPQEKVQYYNTICKRVGIDPALQPFQILQLKDRNETKEIMYATKSCTEQLRMIHGISITSMTTQHFGDCFIVQVSVVNAKGRIDFGTGVVPLKKENGQWKTAQSGKKYFEGNGTFKDLHGDDLANALMKAETKAKRRATLSICGLGMLDETEIETIPDAKPAIGELGELHNAPMPEALGKKIDDVLKNAKPPATAPAKSPEPESDAGNGATNPNATRVTLIEWREKAVELGKKEKFDSVIAVKLKNRSVRKLDELTQSAQDAVLGEMRMLVESWLPMPGEKRKGKLAEKFEALAETTTS